MKMNNKKVKELLMNTYEDLDNIHKLCNSVDSCLDEVEIEIREELCKIKERINIMTCLIDWEEDKRIIK